jgi:hypothetical protein
MSCCGGKLIEGREIIEREGEGDDGNEEEPKAGDTEEQEQSKGESCFAWM